MNIIPLLPWYSNIDTIRHSVSFENMHSCKKSMWKYNFDDRKDRQTLIEIVIPCTNFKRYLTPTRDGSNGKNNAAAIF